MSKKEILFEFIENHNGIITYKDCKALKIPTIYLTRLEKERDSIPRRKRNFPNPEWRLRRILLLSVPLSQGYFLLYLSALPATITDEIPQYFDVTIPRGYRFNTPPANLNIHSVSKEYSELGITLVKTPMGNEVRVYDLERIICDFVIHREK